MFTPDWAAASARLFAPSSEVARLTLEAASASVKARRPVTSSEPIATTSATPDSSLRMRASNLTAPPRPMS
jgi:hypothetical protein